MLEPRRIIHTFGVNPLAKELCSLDDLLNVDRTLPIGRTANEDCGDVVPRIRERGHSADFDSRTPNLAG